MKVLDVVEYDISNYKNPSMFIIFPRCNLKCDKECGKNVCQNSNLLKMEPVDVDIDNLVNKYMHNPLTHAIVFGGLEPFDSWADVLQFVFVARYYTPDPIVIYTGYTGEELKQQIGYLSVYENIIIKFGRYIPDQEPHFDEVLGVELASPNQYAKEIGIDCEARTCYFH